MPRIFGFRVYKKKGSRFQEGSPHVQEITHYTEDQLKKLKGKSKVRQCAYYCSKRNKRRTTSSRSSRSDS